MPTLRLLLLIGLVFGFTACSDDDPEPTDTTADTHESETEPPDQSGKQLRTPTQFIGSPCSCQGNTCSAAGVPQPQNGIISGCDSVPTDWPGAPKVCLRSYEGDFAPNLYFANGYCSLMATKCEGEEIICLPATMGEYDDFVSCPEGSVLVLETKLVTIADVTATVYNKICLVSCDDDADCGPEEIDPSLDNTPTQYQCVAKSGAKFCTDPRTFGPDYVVAP